MAPEALTDIGGDGNRMVKQGRPSDVWSLGCILYQMVYPNTTFSLFFFFFFSFFSFFFFSIIIFFFFDALSYGQPPFHSLNLAMKFKCIPDKNYPINFPPHPDQSLQEVLRACLQRDPALRPTIPQLLSHPFLMPSILTNPLFNNQVFGVFR
jgi:serine/threonine-protein kinase TTK/MPS1